MAAERIYTYTYEEALFAEALSVSPAGMSLSSQERWSRFRDNTETHEHWRQQLGPTAVVSEHQRFFAQFMEGLLHYSNHGFSETEKRILLLAAQNHDCGEARVAYNGQTIGIGDIAAPFKTELIEKEEHKIGLAVLAALNLPTDLLTQHMEAYRQVVVGENQVLHDFFKAVERLEYFNTAITAWHRLHADQLSHARRPSLVNGWNLIAGVLSYDLPKILNMWADKYLTTIGLFLHDAENDLGNMFAYAHQMLALRLQTVDQSPQTDVQGINSLARFQELSAKLPTSYARWETWKAKTI